MTKNEFEVLYAARYEKAVSVAMQACGGARNVAEDAVQAASLEFLETLEQRERITPSMFIRRAADRAKNLVSGPGAVKNKKRDGERPAPEVSVGTALDLDRYLCGPDEGDEN